VVTSEFSTAVLSWPVLCEVTAKPLSRAPLRLASDTVEPGTVVQVTPSGEVDAENVAPVLVIRTYAGSVPAVVTWLLDPPCAVRHCTAIPFPGVAKTA
jgi:hypothetical protein